MLKLFQIIGTMILVSLSVTSAFAQIHSLKGNIDAVHEGIAQLNLGKKHGVQIGTRFKVLTSLSKEVKNFKTGEIRTATVSEAIAIIEVSFVEEEISFCYLNRGDKVKAQDEVIVTKDEPSSSTGLFFPEQGKYQKRIENRLRVFPNIGELSAGIITDLVYHVYFAKYWQFETGINPLGLGIGETITPASVHALASFTIDYFEVGLGLGYSSGFSRSSYSNCDNNGNCTSKLQSTDSGILVNKIRFGSIDGANVLVKYDLGVVENFQGNNQWEKEIDFASFRMELNVPVHRRITLFAGGSGGNGFGYGEGGLKMYFFGVGDSGTLVVPISFGYSSLSTNQSNDICDVTLQTQGQCHDTFIEISGPSLNSGFDYRW